MSNAVLMEAIQFLMYNWTIIIMLIIMYWFMTKYVDCTCIDETMWATVRCIKLRLGNGYCYQHVLSIFLWSVLFQFAWLIITPVHPTAKEYEAHLLQLWCLVPAWLALNLYSFIGNELYKVWLLVQKINMTYWFIYGECHKQSSKLWNDCMPMCQKSRTKFTRSTWCQENTLNSHWLCSHQQYCVVESTHHWWETNFSKFDTQREPGTRGRLVATQHS